MLKKNLRIFNDLEEETTTKKESLRNLDEGKNVLLAVNCYQEMRKIITQKEAPTFFSVFLSGKEEL